jgi:hypothetical protein
MALQNEGKLKKVLEGWQPQTVGTSAWLNSLGVSRQLTKHYALKNWIEPLGAGGFKRPSETVQWYGAVRSLQTQLKLPVHVGALTALSAHGVAHYLRMGSEAIYLFSPQEVRLPSWFTGYDWQAPVQHVKTNVLPESLGLTQYGYGQIDVTISTPERAILECLYLAPNKVDLVECYEIAEGLLNLRPKLMQDLLESCNSIKVKRLFVYMAEKANLPVMKHLDLQQINFGFGDRSLVKSGLYVAKYGLTLPEALVNHGR